MIPNLLINNTKPTNYQNPCQASTTTMLPVLVGLGTEITPRDYWLDLTKPSLLLEWALEMCEHETRELQSLVIHEIPR